jgi:hypothetical protein
MTVILRPDDTMAQRSRPEYENLYRALDSLEERDPEHHHEISIDENDIVTMYSLPRRPELVRRPKRITSDK